MCECSIKPAKISETNIYHENIKKIWKAMDKSLNTHHVNLFIISEK